MRSFIKTGRKVDRICSFCNKNGAEYSHLYKSDETLIDFHPDKQWCYECAIQIKEWAKIIFFQIAEGFTGDFPSLCPVDGCNKPMLYSERAAFTKDVRVLSELYPMEADVRQYRIVFTLTDHISSEGCRLLIADRFYRGERQFRAIVIDDTGQQIERAGEITFDVDEIAEPVVTNKKPSKK